MPEFLSSYILHQKPFKESSLLLTCLLEGQGIVTFLAKGARRPRSPFYPFMRPFLLLDILFQGKGDLKVLTHADSRHFYAKLLGRKMVLGLYINELVVRLCEQEEPLSDLFRYYDEALLRLHEAKEREEEWILRQFECQLIRDLGYGVDLSYTAETKEPIVPEGQYAYDPERGIVLAEESQGSSFVSGKTLIALKEGSFYNEQIVREAKSFTRRVLGHYLGQKTLHSRKLFLKNFA